MAKPHTSTTPQEVPNSHENGSSTQYVEHKPHPYIEIAKQKLTLHDLTILQFYFIDEMLLCRFPNGIVAPREIFEDIVERCRKFYDNVPAEEIAAHNLEIYDQILQGPKCVSRPEDYGYVYILEGGGHYKIGKTNNLNRRISEISPKMPFKATLFYSIETDDPTRLEAILHQRYAHKRVNGEWFDLDREDIQWITSWKKVPFGDWLSRR